MPILETRKSTFCQTVKRIDRSNISSNEFRFKLDFADGTYSTVWFDGKHWTVYEYDWMANLSNCFSIR